MKITNTPIQGLQIIQSEAHQDKRGFFSRLFCSQELEPILGQRHIVQINHSVTCNVGAIRGIHYQNPPHAELKIVRCLKGRIFDVAVDLRRDSATFLQWEAVELTPEKHNAFIIPEGCAHGFQVLEVNSELLYLHTNFYAPNAEAGLPYNDPRLGITWPLEATDLSERDSKHPLLDANFQGITL